MPGTFMENLIDHTFRRRPAVMMAIMVILGVAFATQVPSRPAAWTGLLALGVILSICSLDKPIICSLAICTSFFFAGVTISQLESSQFPDNNIAAFTTDVPQLGEVELQLVSTPHTIVPKMLDRPLPPKQVARAEIKRILTQTGWQSCTGIVAVTIEKTHPMLEVGQNLRVIAQISRPLPPMNPGQFDMAAFCRRQRILTTLHIAHVDAVTILPGDNSQTSSVFDTLRSRARNLMAAGFNESQSLNHAVILALTLGDRESEMRDVQDDFSKSGTAHLLAVSGLHVLVVAAFAIFLCRCIGVSPRAETICMMFTVMTYAIIATPAAPVIRATVLCLAGGFSRLTRRRRDGIQTLSICAAGLLFYHPHELYSAGFQLSFLTVLGMLLCARRVSTWSKFALMDQDMIVARSFQKQTLLQEILFKIRVHLITSLSISAVAWLVSLPLVMYHFDQVTPWSILSGLLMFPIVAITLVTGVFKILLTLMIPSLSPIWASLATLPVRAMRAEVNWLAHLPGSNIAIAPPPIWVLILFYFFLCLPLLPWTIPSIKKILRAAAAAAILLAFLPILIGASPNPTPTGDTRITLLSVGAGQIAVIELPDGRVYLIDDGSSSITDPFRKVLDPYLHFHGVRKIETIFLSHPDFDHISATAETVLQYHPRTIELTSYFRRQTIGNPPAESLLQLLDETHTETQTTSRGDTFNLDPQTSIDVLWPPSRKATLSTNNAGMVLKLSCNGRTILFPADIQTVAERELIERAQSDPSELKCDVLISPHHGSSEVSTNAFLKATSPSIILSSNDFRLSKKQRDFDRMTTAYQCYRTSEYGAITVRITPTGEMSVETFLKPRKKIRP